MAPARHVIVAGAGIAGLTAALALARAGIRVTVFEQAEKLEEAGAGLQLSPNAQSRIDRSRTSRASRIGRSRATGDPRDGRRLRPRDRAYSVG